MKTILYNSIQFPGEAYYDVENSSTTAHKVEINKIGMGSIADAYQRVEFDITDPNNPIELSSVDSGGNVNGIYTFPDGDTFNPTNREYTFASGVNRFLSASVNDNPTPSSDPVDDQITDPVITSDTAYVNNDNHIVYLSKLTKVTGSSGVVAVTDSDRPGEVVLSIDSDYIPTLPDDLTGETLSISGNATMHATTVTDLTISGNTVMQDATVADLTGDSATISGTVSSSTVAMDSLVFNKQYTMEEFLALPKNSLVQLTSGSIVLRT